VGDPDKTGVMVGEPGVEVLVKVGVEVLAPGSGGAEGEKLLEQPVTNPMDARGKRKRSKRGNLILIPVYSPAGRNCDLRSAF